MDGKKLKPEAEELDEALLEQVAGGTDELPAVPLEDNILIDNTIMNLITDAQPER